MSLKLFFIRLPMLAGFFAFTCVSSCASTPATHETPNSGVLLVANGQPKSVIVLPDLAGRQNDEMTTRMETQAANVLVDFLQRMSGVKINVVRMADLGDVKVEGERITSAKMPFDSYILIGDSDLARRLKFPPEATEAGATYVSVAGNTVLLMGAADGSPYQGGAVYSVHSLLETLGCRYLWPGKVGLVIPSRTTITVPVGTEEFVPPIKQRNLRMSFGYDRAMRGAQQLGISNDEWKKAYLPAAEINPQFVERGLGDWPVWQKIGGNTGIVGGHIFGALWDQEGKAHPGWFALQPNGSRTQHNSERARLCVSNSELITHIADGIIAQVKADPTIKSVSLSPNDGGPDTFCMCTVNALGEPGCTTLDSPKGRKIPNFRGWNRDYVSLTDRYIYFWNKIAERVVKVKPDLLFVVDAYSYYEAPPVERTLHPNLVVRYIQSTFRDWDEWSKKTSKIYWRPNILHTSWQLGYLQMNREWARNVNFAAHHGTIAADFDSILNSWATEGLNYYVLSKLNYNPDLDVDALVDDYCKVGFGPAGVDIRKYYDLTMTLTDKEQGLENVSNEERAKAIVQPRVDAFVSVYQPDKIAQLRVFLDAADANSNQDEAVRKRIAFLRVGLDWTDIQSRAYRILIAWRQKQPVDMVAAGKLLEQRREMMRSIFRNNTLAVNISYAYFGDRGFWQVFEAEIAEATKKQGGGTTGKTILVPDEEGRPIAMPAP